MKKNVEQPSERALEMHREACRDEEAGYMDPDSGLFVMTSYHLRDRGYCCGNGCRHCPFTERQQRQAGRPEVGVWPWPEGDE